MFNRPKINKSVLKCECMNITPNGYAPDIFTQMRLNPRPFVFAIHQLVICHLAETGIKIPDGGDKATNVKRACVYRTMLTDILLKQIDRLPQEDKNAVYSDPETGFPIIKNCLTEAQDNFVFGLLKPSTVNRIWNGIRCAYGSKHAAPQEIILSTFNVIEREPESAPANVNASANAYL